MSKLSVIFDEINATRGHGGRRRPGPAESAFTIYRFGRSHAGRRDGGDRNRRSNGDRERVGFKISKMSNIRFKRDGRDYLMPAIRHIGPDGELSAFHILTSRFRSVVPRYKLDAPFDHHARKLFTKHSCLVMLLLTPYE